MEGERGGGAGCRLLSLMRLFAGCIKCFSSPRLSFKHLSFHVGCMFPRGCPPFPTRQISGRGRRYQAHLLWLQRKQQNENVSRHDEASVDSITPTRYWTLCNKHKYLYSIGLFSYHITFSHPRGNVGPSRLKYLPYIIYYNTGWTFTFSKELFLLILMNFCFFFCRAFLWYLNIYLMVQYMVLISQKTAPPLRCEGATRWHDKKRAQGEAPTWEHVENKTEIYDILCIFLQNARTVTSDLCGNF